MSSTRSLTVLTIALSASMIATSVAVDAVNANGNASLLSAAVGRITNTRKSVPAQKDTRMEERIAVRLQNRLRDQKIGVVPTVGSLTQAVQERQALLRRGVTVHFTADDAEARSEWAASLQRYPLWITPKIGVSSVSFTLNAERIQETIQNDKILDLPVPQDITLTRVRLPDETKDVLRAETTGIAKPGYVVDQKSLATIVHDALAKNVHTFTFPLQKRDGIVKNETGMDLGDLELLATGRSNFSGSDNGRIGNVRKALRQHVYNSMVAPGETFSFNDTLGGPVSQGRGWNMAKVIFNGGDLEYAPGGGICQASTTTYRAALNAGFPITERAAHSLYVSYYKAHGVGIDATIFPGKQDLTFVNDSPSYLLIQSYDDGFEAYVNIYGTKDDRTVALEGPYFASTAPKDLRVNGRPVRSNEIVWLQKVRYADGRVIESTISSQYNKGIPGSLAKEFPATLLHASAVTPQ